jgi:hypothetical protein
MSTSPFYVSIITHRNYGDAVKALLSTLPIEFKNKYILIYSQEQEYDIKNCEDGHIEVKIKNNIYDYGNWVGVSMLLENNIVPQNSWFLFIHDTCKFVHENSAIKINGIINSFDHTDIDIIWTSHNGISNYCLARRNGVKIGGARYHPILTMPKMEAISYEWNHGQYLSPKSIDVPQFYINCPVKCLGTRDVYNSGSIRTVLLHDSVGIEKYFFYTAKEGDHHQHP